MFTRDEKSRMEDNNIHTSVVIELANPKGESEEKKSYQIDIDDMNAPKDYVIDQIFCGENVTVYALFEVPENESRNLDNSFMEVSNANIENDNTFYYKNSFKKITNEKKLNGYKQSVISSEQNLKFFSDANSRNKSLYCLKHPRGNYDLLPPERENSDLKVLYSKNFSLEKSKSSKFKAISVGVNTDIVQSPRIIEEVQKVLGVNVPLLKFKDRNIEATNSFSVPSYNATEVETRPSLSSLASSTESRNYTGKSISNLFFVPLLMMEDDNLNKFLKNENSQKNLEKEKLFSTKDLVSKVSLGINTDASEFDSCIELHKKKKQNTQETLNFETSENISQSSDAQQEDQNMDAKLKQNERRTILKEIKTMQLKLSALIKNIESSDLESDSKEYDLTESESKLCSETTENLENKEKFIQNSLESFDKSEKNQDDRSVLLLPWTAPLDNKTNLKNETEDSGKIEKEENPINIIESVFDDALPDEESFVTETEGDNERVELNKTASYCKINWKSLENPKIFALSKSEINLYNNIKHNCLKKSLSLDFRNLKTDFFKNIKNYLVKQEGSLKTNVKGIILPNNEVYSGDNESLLKSEVGDDANKKLASKTNLIISCQENKNREIPDEIETESDLKKIRNEDEGDAKFDKPKKNELSTIFVKEPEKVYFDPNITASDGLLSPKKSLCSCKKETKPPDKIIDKKTCSDSEKPPTPNGNFRKIITTNSNVKKDLKVIKKTINRHKVIETTTRMEVPYKRILTGCRKPNKVNAESKLHIDKLIKTGNLGNNKVSQVIKSNNDEKSTTKGDRSYRPSSQKLETRDHPVEVHTGSNKETENKCSKKKSSLSIQVDIPSKKRCSPKTKIELSAGFESNEESASHLSSQKKNPSSSDSSSVVVKLLSKKPTSIKNFCSESHQERVNLEETPREAHRPVRSSKNQKESNLNVENMEKSIVKSVWALTKVLLFEDGTKKLEVLEASLTPPEYSLNQSVKTSK